jgi:hypothetical protein
MTHRIVLLFALATSAAYADAPLEAFLEQRVAEELAADGMQLSRLGVSLDVEVIGSKAIVSLVDPGTGRVVASTKLDALPVDREAAVASVTQVAANLATQLQPPPPGDLKQALQDERAERERKEALEAQYKAAMIHFGHVATTDDLGATTGTASVPLKGDRRLGTIEFLREIERPDLVEQVRSRRRLGLGIAIAGGAVIAVGSYLIYRGRVTWGKCDGPSESHDECMSSATRQLGFGMGTVLGGTVVAIIGEIVARKSPISEQEVHDLADQHNAKLRQRFEVTPQFTRGGATLTLGGRF